MVLEDRFLFALEKTKLFGDLVIISIILFLFYIFLKIIIGVMLLQLKDKGLYYTEVEDLDYYIAAFIMPLIVFIYNFIRAGWKKTKKED